MCSVSDLRIEIARVLERWQLERAELECSEQRDDAQLQMLNEHIEQLKAAVGKPGADEPCIVGSDLKGIRFPALSELRARVREVVGNTALSSGELAEQVEDALQASEASGRLTQAETPPACPTCKSPGRLADRIAHTFTCDACGALWQRRPRTGAGHGPSFTVRQLRHG